MGVKSLLLFFLVAGGLSAALIYYCPALKLCFIDVDPPVLHPEYFGRGKISGDFPKDNPAINKYKINIDNYTLSDLKTRLARTRFVEPLDNVAFQYGFHASTLKKVVDYWLNKFDWRKQEKELNKFNHFTTQIEGINVHFIHAKPDLKGKKLRVLPLLLIHGWPGSVVEFTKIIPMLTTPRAGRDYVFEVICPSIPGYGFSEAPHQPGFDPLAAARGFAILMERLGFKRYYVQGGDWGAVISSVLSKSYADRVAGVHFNMVAELLGPVAYLKYAVGYVFPSFFMTQEEHDEIYALKSVFRNFLEESGYFHIQATKPDTIGAAMTDSPAGLAAYILEKFAVSGGFQTREKPDGGLTDKFTMDELLTNVMVYWATNKSASSFRFYKESMSPRFKLSGIERLPVKVPSGVATFPREILRLPCSFLTHHFRKLVRCKRIPRGGHFAAMEEPQLLADEVWEFVADIEKAEKAKTEKK